MEIRTEKAVTNHKSFYTCSASVLAAFADKIGISESEARILQQQAFAGAVLETISRAELRDRLSRLVERRLRGEDTVCAGCDKRCC